MSQIFPGRCNFFASRPKYHWSPSHGAFLMRYTSQGLFYESSPMTSQFDLFSGISPRVLIVSMYISISNKLSHDVFFYISLCIFFSNFGTKDLIFKIHVKLAFFVWLPGSNHLFYITKINTAKYHFLFSKCIMWPFYARFYPTIYY